MKRLALVVLTGSAILLLTGCVSSMRRQVAKAELTQVNSRNYQLCQSMTAAVGEVMIARKCYQAYLRTDSMAADSDFHFHGGFSPMTNVNHFGKQGDTFRIIGINQKRDVVIDLPRAMQSIGIGADGTWDGTVMTRSFWTSAIGGGKGYSMDPPSTTFRCIQTVTPLEQSDYINHELIFSGIGEDGIHLLYREYTAESLSRPTYAQSVIYPKDSKHVRLKGYVLAIDSIESSHIAFTVESEPTHELPRPPE